MFWICLRFRVFRFEFLFLDRSSCEYLKPKLWHICMSFDNDNNTDNFYFCFSYARQSINNQRSSSWRVFVFLTLALFVGLLCVFLFGICNCVCVCIIDNYELIIGLVLFKRIYGIGIIYQFNKVGVYHLHLGIQFSMGHLRVILLLFWLLLLLVACILSLTIARVA